tara:strand:- start:2407 stop:2589 length:183 start_codon:yes stop_codon:yes gene_type:complete
MSRGNPVIKNTIVTLTRMVQDQSPEQRMAEIENQLKPFKIIEMENKKNRVLQGRNIVIPQ